MPRGRSWWVPESTPSSKYLYPLFVIWCGVCVSRNLPLPPWEVGVDNKFVEKGGIFWESQNIPPFSTNLFVRPSQNLPLPNSHDIAYPPPFSTTICHTLRIYPSLPEYTPLFNNKPISDPPESTPPSRNIPPSQQIYYYGTLPESTLSPSQNIPPLSTTMCDTPRIYKSLHEYTPLFNKFHVPPRIWEK